MVIHGIAKWLFKFSLIESKALNYQVPAALGLFHRNKEDHVYGVDSLLLKRLGSLEKENKVTVQGLSWDPENLHLKNETFLT